MKGAEEIFPHLGPFPLQDIDRMRYAVIQLLKTLDLGKHEKTVQKDCPIPHGEECLNCFRCSMGSVGRNQGLNGYHMQDMTKSFLTTSPSKSQWFSWFMQRNAQESG